MQRRNIPIQQDSSQQQAVLQQQMQKQQYQQQDLNQQQMFQQQQNQNFQREVQIPIQLASNPPTPQPAPVPTPQSFGQGMSDPNTGRPGMPSSNMVGTGLAYGLGMQRDPSTAPLPPPPGFQPTQRFVPVNQAPASGTILPQAPSQYQSGEVLSDATEWPPQVTAVMMLPSLRSIKTNAFLAYSLNACIQHMF